MRNLMESKANFDDVIDLLKTKVDLGCFSKIDE